MTDQTLDLTSEEAAELEMLIKRESASSAVELRHTGTRTYRDLIRHRMEVLEAIVKKLARDKPAGSAV